MVRFCLCCILCMALSSAVAAREIAGVDVPETLQGSDGVELQLNGAGIRSKLFIKVYIAGLYLQNLSSDAAAVLADDGQRRMVMHFLYKEVKKEQLTEAWNDGFKGNLEPAALAALQPQIDTFNAMFDTVQKGDVIELAYMPGKGLTVTVKGEEKGVIEGKSFADAVFSIWLGGAPVTTDLKKELLAAK